METRPLKNARPARLVSRLMERRLQSSTPRKRSLLQHFKVSVHSLRVGFSEGFAFEQENHITVSPNPASQVLLVTFDNPIEDGCRLSLVNQLGVTVFGRDIPANPLSVFVPIEDVIPGVYVLRIQDTDGNEFHLSKLVVVK